MCPDSFADIQGRINLIRRQIEETTSDYDPEKPQARLAKLAGGVAVSNVGAATAIELKREEGLRRRRAARHPFSTKINEMLQPLKVSTGTPISRAI
jgi:hypothetical protein